MNLKEAAQRLGVHYQTAYKWVRSGALTAVKVGARYEVSDAAINQFLASRRSLLAEVEPRPALRRATDLTEEDVLDELESMAMDPVLTESSIATFAARRGAEVLGDLCLVLVNGADGRSIKHAVIDHPQPDRAAFIRAAVGAMTMTPTLADTAVITPFITGDTVRIAHVPQDELRAAVRPELRQYADRYPIHSVLSAPIRVEGTVLGLVMFARDTANAPYTAEDEFFAARMGTRLGWLVHTAREIKRAWRLRRELAQSLSDQIARHGVYHPDAIELDQLLRAHREESDLLIGVLDPTGRFIAANDAFVKVSGYSRQELLTLHALDVTPPEDVATERANFERLTSGEVDYLDTHTQRTDADGRTMSFASHRVAVRDPDATLECIIAVGRPVHARTSHPLLAGVA